MGRRKADKAEIEIIETEIIEKCKVVCQLYSTGEFSMEECCLSAGVPYSSFYRYLGEFPDVAKELTEAKKLRATILSFQLREKAIKSFDKLITGYDAKESRTIIKPVEKKLPNGEIIKENVVESITSSTKHIQPHAGAVMFALINTDPMNFKYRGPSFGNEAESGDEKVEAEIIMPDGTRIVL